MADMRYRVLGRSGMKVSELCLGTMLFGELTDAAEARRIIDHAADHGVNFIDTANVYAGGRSEAVIGPAIAAHARPLGAGHQGRAADRPRRHRSRPVAAARDAGRGREPGAPPDRSHRSLLHPPGRSRHRVGGDHRRLRRPDPPGQGPRVGALERQGLAHPARPSPVPAARRAAADGAPALLQPDEPPARGRGPAGGPGVRPWGRALQPAGARRPDRQVQGERAGRSRQPGRASGPAHAGVGVA